MNYLAALRGEFAKNLRRPMLWVTVLVPYSLILASGYWADYRAYLAVQEGRMESPLEPWELLFELVPASFVARAAGDVPFTGAVVVVILTAIVLASEYGNDTMKVALTQGPSRSQLLAAKATTLAVAILATLLAAFGTGAWASQQVASAAEVTSSFPGLADIVMGFAYAYLGMASWAAAALLIATVTRSGGLTIAVAFLYLAVVEGIVGEFAADSRLLGAVYEYLLTPNLESMLPAAQHHVLATGTVIGQGRALLVLAVYMAGSLAFAITVLRRRDVT